MANAYYTCNLLPIEFVARSGYSPRWLGNYLQDPATPARREALSVHPMTCPYVTQLVAAADVLLGDAPAEDCLLVPGGCDAMRRMGDLLAAAYPDRVFVLSMPRSSGEGVVRTLAADLARMEDWLTGRLADDSPAEAGANGATAPRERPAVDYPIALRPGGVFVVAGPLSDDSLLGLIERLGAQIAGLESCTSPDRWKPLARATPAGEAGTDDGYQTLAAELLAIGMCPRRSTADRRDYLARRLDETRPSSVIYARQSFCDPGAYDALAAAALAKERGLPYLEIEVGFPFDAGGPLRTRVEAFLEAQLLDDDLLDDDLPGED
ncbi:MAG: 2-hydroxyacyl-CoA dehydratase family protein [bacterium]